RPRKCRLLPRFFQGRYPCHRGRSLVMKRIAFVLLVTSGVLLASCNKQQPAPRAVVTPTDDSKQTPPVQPVVSGPAAGSDANDPSKAIDAILSNLGEQSKQEQYDAALL